MCCKLLRIEALDKPSNTWCTHCDVGTGCKIYAERPDECRIFNCGYLTQPQIGEHWQPARARMVLALSTNGKRLTIFVDPDRRDAWRKEPYLSDIRGWARAAARNDGRVVVSQGAELIAITPAGESRLGTVEDGQIVIGRRGADGTTLDPIVVDRDDPIVPALTLLKDPAAAKAATPEELAEARRQVDAWLARQDA